MDTDKTSNEVDNDEELEQERPRRSWLSRIAPPLLAVICVIGYRAYKIHSDSVKREKEQEAMLYKRIQQTVQPVSLDPAVEEALKAQSLRYNSDDVNSTSDDDQTVVAEEAVQ